jgi:hypothetical protein
MMIAIGIAVIIATIVAVAVVRRHRPVQPTMNQTDMSEMYSGVFSGGLADHSPVGIDLVGDGVIREEVSVPISVTGCHVVREQNECRVCHYPAARHWPSGFAQCKLRRDEVIESNAKVDEPRFRFRRRTT